MGFIPITLPGTTGIKLALDFDTSTLYYNISGEYGCYCYCKNTAYPF